MADEVGQTADQTEVEEAANIAPGYAAPNVNDMWLAWQASRAALCVTLPIAFSDERASDQEFQDAEELAAAAKELTVKLLNFITGYGETEDVNAESALACTML